MGLGLKLVVIGWTLGTVALATDLQVETLLQRGKSLKSQDMISRVEFFSRSLLGAPYVDGPTGDGPKDPYDPQPMYRLDAFDCTTYVETVLALSASKTPQEFEKWIERIRYQGKPSFVHRNHFPCTEWLPHNQQLGFLTDITAQVGSRWGVQYADAPIDRKSWFAALTAKVIRTPGLSTAEKEKRLAALKREGQSFRKTTPSIPYIPLASFTQTKPISDEVKNQRKQEEDKYIAEQTEELKKEKGGALPEDAEEILHAKRIDFRLRYLIEDVTVQRELLDAIPTGTLLNVVRPGWSVPGTKMNISHQGLVFRKGSDTYFRHTSRTGKRAKDVLLENYVRLSLLVPSIKGINLLSIHAPTPSLAKQPKSRHK